MRLVSLAIAALAGASMAVQGTLNAILGRKMGSFEAAFIVHVIGSLLLGAMLLTGLSHGSLRQAAQTPWYAFMGGPLSVLIIWGVLVSVSRVGVSSANTAIVGAQIAVALALDFLGAGGERLAFSWVKVLGAALFIAGAYLLLRQPPAAS